VPDPISFFVADGSDADGDRFEPTTLTRGPWSAESEHAGPPAALLARAVEHLPGGDGLRVARFAVDILRPIPVAPLLVSARVAREARRVRLVEATLTAGGTEVVRAAAWQIRVDPDATASVGLHETLPFPGPDASTAQPTYDPGWEPNYFTGMELRFARGSVFELGPAVCWFRQRAQLVAGEDPSPLCRVIVAADSGNGISAVLPFRDHLFANIDLTVHLAREPAGEWVCLDSRTRVSSDGVGYTDSDLWDESGRIGVAAESLLVARRTHNAPPQP
jgi:Thioesterase-like superfamily